MSVTDGELVEGVQSLIVWTILLNVVGVPTLRFAADLPPVVGTSWEPVSKRTGGLHLIFIPDEHRNPDNFRRDIRSIAIRSMHKAPPWSEHPRKLVSVAVWPEEDLCTRETEDHTSAYRRCDHDKLVEMSQQCTADAHKLVVISREEFPSHAPMARLKESVIYLSVSNEDTELTASALRATQATFLHELGHAFGLRDEWAPIHAKANSPARKPAGPNCVADKDTATEWWGGLVGQQTLPTHIGPVGYFRGCVGDADYIKPTRNSLMGTTDLSLGYGPVSERYLDKILKYCFSDAAPSYQTDTVFFDRYPAFMARVRAETVPDPS